jgi:hypothetical protein
MDVCSRSPAPQGNTTRLPGFFPLAGLYPPALFPQSRSQGEICVSVYIALGIQHFPRFAANILTRPFEHLPFEGCLEMLARFHACCVVDISSGSTSPWVLPADEKVYEQGFFLPYCNFSFLAATITSFPSLHTSLEQQVR